MSKYYTLEQNKPSFLEKIYNIIFPIRKSKPVTLKPRNDINPEEFYQKYGIIYSGNITNSCLQSLF